MFTGGKSGLNSLKFNKNASAENGGANPSNKRAAAFPSPQNQHKRQRIDAEGSEGDIAPRLTLKVQPKAKRLAQANGGSSATPQKNIKQLRKERAQLLSRARMDLPVASGKEAILEALAANDSVVVLGETGSGKTTQIPQYIMDSNVPCPQPRICITQPRRVATVTLATRVAEEVGCFLGGLVGYTVRFDDKSNDKTRLKFVTDGTLLQEILADRTLSRYDVVIVDEAHERTLRTDMVLGFLKQIQKDRQSLSPRSKSSEGLSSLGPLKIVVMSATLDAERFSHFFNEAKFLYVKGRQHKVKVQYCKAPQDDYMDAALRTFFQIHTTQPPGDVLVFLSGEEDIENLNSSIEAFCKHLKPHQEQVQICPLYAKLTPQQQAKAFARAPAKTRKVILATNVAETSVTIPGIKYVIDTGVMKEKNYQARMGVDTLLVAPISQSSAQQRSGRAGRESAGTCYRLYTENDYRNLQRSSVPEIQRCSLCFALLHLLATGQEDVFEFEFMDAPDRNSMTMAMLDLLALGAINEQKKITDLGRAMANFPLDPTSARILLASFELGCPNEIVSLVSLMAFADAVLVSSAQNREQAQEAHSRFLHRDGDHLTLLNVLNAYEAMMNTNKGDRLQWCKDNFVNARTLANVVSARQQLRKRCDSMQLDWRKSCGDEPVPVLEACMAGLYQNCAVLGQDDVYRKLVGRMVVKIHPASVLHQKKARVIIYNELVMTSQTYARCVSAVPVSILKAGMFFRQT